MIRKTILASLLLATAVAGHAAPVNTNANAPGEAAVKAAKYAAATYRNDIVDTLARLVSYNTVADPKVPSDKNPVHIAFKTALKQEAQRLIESLPG